MRAEHQLIQLVKRIYVKLGLCVHYLHFEDYLAVNFLNLVSPATISFESLSMKIHSEPNNNEKAFLVEVVIMFVHEITLDFCSKHQAVTKVRLQSQIYVAGCATC